MLRVNKFWKYFQKLFSFHWHCVITSQQWKCHSFLQRILEEQQTDVCRDGQTLSLRLFLLQRSGLATCLGWSHVGLWSRNWSPSNCVWLALEPLSEPKTFRWWSRSRRRNLCSGSTALVCGASELTYSSAGRHALSYRYVYIIFFVCV